MPLTRYHCKLVKRFLLITIALPFLAGVPYPELDWARSLYYIVFTSSLATYALLLNFPSIVRRVHSRPLYYGDLADEKYVDPAIRKRFQHLFTFILQITLTVIISGLIYYYYDKMQVSILSDIEMIGVLGGFISLLLKLEHAVGKLALSCLNWWKNTVTKTEVGHERNIRRMRANSLEIIIAV
jgi:hypothetical protein